MNRIKIGILITAICLLQITSPQILSACPTCKDNLHSDGTAFAFAFSVLFMMAMPFVIMTFWVTTIVRLRRVAAIQGAAFDFSGQIEPMETNHG